MSLDPLPAGKPRRPSPAQQGFTPGRVARGVFSGGCACHESMVRQSGANLAPLFRGSLAPTPRGCMESQVEGRTA